jgi:hypothetical protein
MAGLTIASTVYKKNCHKVMAEKKIKLPLAIFFQTCVHDMEKSHPVVKTGIA